MQTWKRRSKTLIIISQVNQKQEIVFKKDKATLIHGKVCRLTSTLIGLTVNKP